MAASIRSDRSGATGTRRRPLLPLISAGNVCAVRRMRHHAIGRNHRGIRSIATIVRRLLALFLVGLVACGGPSPTVSPARNDVPAQAADARGPYRLTFTVPRTAWSTTDAIVGDAQLALIAGLQTRIFGSGAGVLAFEFQEVTGDRHVAPIWTADCAPYVLAANQPIRSAITKSGGWSADQPDAQFYSDFFADPIVRLPPGTWDITALASFVEGEGCGGVSRALRATVRVHVTD